MDYLLYHIIVMLPILLYFTNINYKLKKVITSILILVVGVFLCFGYMTGSDWIAYELVYEDLSLHVFYEVGYVALMNIGYFLGLDFFPFLILTKFICYLLIVRCIRLYSGEGFLFSFSFFISFFGLYLFIDNPLRNLLAIVVFLYSIQFFYTKKYFYYFLFGCLAVSFHKSALLIFCLLPLIKLPFKKLYRLLLLTMILFVLLGVSGLFTRFFQFFIDVIPFFNKFSESYLEEGSEYTFRDSLNAKSVVFVLIFGIILFKEKYSNVKDQTIAFKLFLLYATLFVVTIFVPIFDRFTFYFAVFFVSILVRHMNLFKPINKLGFSVLVILILFLNTHTMIMNKYVYLPYTNYLSYMFKDKPSYNYRLNYNHKNSPATNKK